MTEKLYVVAFSQKEAEELADAIGWNSRSDAEAHLAWVKEPPTDPFYGSQYRIWTVVRGTDGKQAGESDAGERGGSDE